LWRGRLADKFEFESRRKIEVELHSGELPGSADGVDKFHVDFGAVKRAFARHFLIGDVHARHHPGESI